MSSESDTIVIKAPAGTKARWVRQAQRESRKLSDWIIQHLEQPVQTQAQFEALAKLLGLHSGPATDAARLVLVDGLSAIEASQQAGCSRQSATNAVTRCRRGLELAYVAVGMLIAEHTK